MNDAREQAGLEANDLEARIMRALEAMPKVALADDFAARVMHRVPARPARRRVLIAEQSYVGRRVMLAAMVALAVLMLGLAPWAWGAGHVALTVVEWMLCAEFIGLTLWLSPVKRLLQR